MREVLGSQLVGKKYKPVFDYYATFDIENFENGWSNVTENPARKLFESVHDIKKREVFFKSI